MSKTLKMDFYKIEIPDSSISFREVLQNVHNLPNDKRVREVRRHQVWLCEAYIHQHLWEGDMIRLRMTDIPIKGNLSGNVEEINLADHEGIGERTAFLYHIPTKILVLQSSQAGTSPQSFAEYFRRMGELDTEIYLDPVLQIDAMQRLTNIQTVRKFEVRTAGLDSMEIIKDQNVGVQQFVKMSEIFRAPTLSVSLSIGHKKKSSLSVDTIKELAHKLTRISQQNNQNVKKLRISGSTDEGENIKLDLINNRMREIIDINPGKQRSIPYTLRKEAVKKAWENRKNELNQMFNSK
ncbi:DUF6731 family protein [Coleofasciculus sp. E1-EBD-02]|uniref:DUF6731 family protein n=1 Tax=Coleofasciculus sp. E1-EBD-02 TaxID=3068481 RepID=UPI0032F6AAE8